MSDNNRQVTVFQKPGDLMGYLQKSMGAVKMALPKHLNPDRMLRLAVTCFSTTPKLRQCTGQSILASVIVASQLGLEPGIAGQGYLIPYKQTCTFVPGWQGLVGLLNNSGRATAWTGAVFEGDEWEFELGSRPICRHVPGQNFGDPDAMRWVYACGKVNGSEQPIIEAWPMARVWKHRDRFNKVGRDHYSYVHPEAYARKVVLLQVLKYLPRSIELNNALVAANATESGNTVRVDDGVVIEVESQAAPPSHPMFDAPAKPTRPAAAPESGPEPGGIAGDEQGASSAAATAEAGPSVAPDETVADADLPAAVNSLLKSNNVDEKELMAWALAKGIAKKDQTRVYQLATRKLRQIVDEWTQVQAEIFDARDAKEAAADAPDA